MNAPPESTRAARWQGGAAIALTLLAFAAAVLWARLQLGAQMRAHILDRDAVILQTLAQREAAEVAAQDSALDLAEPSAQYAMLLGMADLTNIIAARLFDADGRFVAGVPIEVKEAALGEATLAQLRALAPVTRFRPAAPRHELFLYLPELDSPQSGTLAWVEVYVPLYTAQDRTLLGVAQFMLEGYSLRREFARLDRRLNLQSVLIFGVGTVLIVVGLGWAFRRLERANRLLATRTADLQRANQALADAAKTAAVGAVTAHLIHSLKNPVAGLQSFVVARQDAAAPAESEEWREALAATCRMQSLIQQVVQVLRDQERAPAFTLTLAELAGAVAAQTRALAAGRGVRFETRCEGESALDNRVAGLLRLILANLVQNAIEATPRGGGVGLALRANGSQVIAEVRDQGPGLPEPVRARLFEPVRSTKEGGSGIGLAISRQLAQHLGAELMLVSTSAQGTVFRVTLPRAGA
jgi:signal transduction histidine kinase